MVFISHNCLIQDESSNNSSDDDTNNDNGTSSIDSDNNTESDTTIQKTKESSTHSTKSPSEKVPKKRKRSTSKSSDAESSNSTNESESESDNSIPDTKHENKKKKRQKRQKMSSSNKNHEKEKKITSLTSKDKSSTKEDTNDIYKNPQPSTSYERAPSTDSDSDTNEIESLKRKLATLISKKVAKTHHSSKKPKTKKQKVDTFLQELNENKNQTCKDLKIGKKYKMIKLQITEEQAFGGGTYKRAYGTLQDKTQKNGKITVPLPRPIAVYSDEKIQALQQRIKEKKFPFFIIHNIEKRDRIDGKGQYDYYDFQWA